MGARLATLIITLLLVGCAPVLTYDELSEEARITGDNTKVEKFEAMARKAELHYQNKARCNASSGLLWYCDGSFREREFDPTWSLDELVKNYRRDHMSCSCVNKARQLEELNRVLGF